MTDGYEDLGGQPPEDLDILDRYNAKQVSHVGRLKLLIQRIEPVSAKTLTEEPQFPREVGDNGEDLNPDRFRRQLEQRRRTIRPRLS